MWASSSVSTSAGLAKLAIRRREEQAIEIKPELLTIRPLLETIVETLVTTPFFRKVLALAITDLHRGLLGSDERSYAIDLSNALAVGVGRLRVVNPQLADQIPPDIH